MSPPALASVLNLPEEILSEFNISLNTINIIEKSELFFLDYEPMFYGEILPEQPNLIMVSGLVTQNSSSI